MAAKPAFDHGTLLGLDVGSRRIGVALARSDVRMARPLTTLAAEDAVSQISDLIRLHDVVAVVAGWPRGMAGQHTDQTVIVENFVEALRQAAGVPVYLQDEALTSQKAEAELAARRKPYSRPDIDALAATYILEDFINEQLAMDAKNDA